MRVKHILIPLLLVLVQFLYPQKKDSLYKVYINTALNDTARIKAMHVLGWMYAYTKPDSALLFAEQSTELSKKNGNKRLESLSLRLLTKVLYFKCNYPLSMDYTLVYLKVNEEINNERGIADAYNMIANLNHEMGDNKKALEYHLKSLNLKLKIGYKEGIAGSYNNIGNIYGQTGKMGMALENYKKALAVFEELKQEHNIAGININIGDAYQKLNKPDKALEHFNITYELAQKVGDKGLLASVLSAIGNLKLKKGEIQEAKKYCEKGLELANEIGAPEPTQENCGCLYKVYEALGDYKKAYTYHAEFIKIRDTLNSERNIREITSKTFQFNYEKKAAADSTRNADMQKVKDAEQQAALKQEATKRYALFAILLLVVVFAAFVFNRFKLTQKQNKVIAIQKTEVERQKQIIEAKNKEVTDSIHYAQRIQQALLASDTLLKEKLGEYFVLFQPKDIVSGDFYWAAIVQNSGIGVHRNDAGAEQRTPNSGLFFLAVCDSTGHGVPGAFMSLLNISFLNEAVNEQKLQRPDEILAHVRKRLIESLGHDGLDSKDGMDCSLMCFDRSGPVQKLIFSSANNPIVILRKGELIEFPSDRMPVGRSPKENEPFTLHTFNLQEGDMIYAFTDGFADQFGGDAGKKFKRKKLIQTLLEHHYADVRQQKEIISSIFMNWKGNLEQIDDVCLVGIRI